MKKVVIVFLGLLLVFLSSCTQGVVKETVIVEKEIEKEVTRVIEKPVEKVVEKIVKETVIVEKEVTREVKEVVKETVVVERPVEITRVVEKVVTATPEPTPSLSALSVGPYENVLLVKGSSVDYVGKYAATLSGLVDTLRGAGFSVHILDGEMKISTISQYGVIVYHAGNLNENEVGLIREWILAGGGALLIRECSDINAIVLGSTGIKLDDSYVADERHRDAADWGFYTKQVNRHSATEGVNILVFSDHPRSVSLTQSGATILITGEEDAHNDYYTYKPPLAAAAEMGQGRVIVVAGYWIFTSGQHPAAMFDNRDNQLFALRVVEWLARRR